ncbi:anthocyanin 5-aromatic acyltransferase-like [Cornus florida]|uniref:anthocyanin 5-aromatic acyltransferase-like n=1 Tax=Cornus florida TaxID=4283 RepID=UPI0028A29CAD|nr:anthocyanin 5-aromatic acyltransferase-like [Cornus florida]
MKHPPIDPITQQIPQANTMNVIEHCRISPPPGTVADQLLPLTFFDIPFIPLPHIQKLLFYEFHHHSKTHFTDTLIPHLKHSLSLTLKHFFPLAANLILPSSNSSNPQIRYAEGDSVSLVFSESSDDFNYLTGNQERNADQFHLLIPQITNWSDSVTTVEVVPLAAIQVTLFPESGICFGFAYHHVLADGKAFHGFMKSWASISKFGWSDAELLGRGYLPFCDRTVIKDTIGLDTIYWRQVCEDWGKNYEICQTQTTNYVRATFIISRMDVQRLKELVMARQHSIVQLHVSTFTVTCAYMWICILKSRASTRVDSKNDDDDDDELEYFGFTADCRGRLDPPMPATYFGNCLAFCFARATHGQLMEEKQGFFVAAESIGAAIAERLHEPEGVLKGAETWLSELKSLKMDRLRSIAGSPKISLYEPDFGWGRPRKTEIISIDFTGAFSISECRDSQGDVEFGVSLPKITMDAFASIFVNDLKKLM